VHINYRCYHSNWDGGQPDNGHGVENCVEIKSDSGQWNDKECADTNFYVCEDRYSRVVPYLYLTFNKAKASFMNYGLFFEYDV